MCPCGSTRGKQLGLMKFAFLKCSLFSLKEYLSTTSNKTAETELCFQFSCSKLACDLQVEMHSRSLEKSKCFIDKYV